MATVSRKASAYETPSLRTRFQTPRSRGSGTQSTYGKRCRRPRRPTASFSSQHPSAPSFQPPFAEGNTLPVIPSSPEDTSNDGEGSVGSIDNVLAEETSGFQTEEAEGLEAGETSGLQPEQHEDPEHLESLNGTETASAGTDGPTVMLRSTITGHHWIRVSGGQTFEATPTEIALFGNLLDSIL
jgi:hypothetical protein